MVENLACLQKKKRVIPEMLDDDGDFTCLLRLFKTTANTTLVVKEPKIKREKPDGEITLETS